MPTLAEILASRKQKPEVKIEAPAIAIATKASDIHHILAFLFLLDNPDHHQDHIELLSFFNIPYTPWIIKATNESPSSSLAFLVARYYNQKYPVRASLELSSHVLRGIGRVLDDKQLELLTREIERRLNGRESQ